MATQSRCNVPAVLLTRPAAQSARFADEMRARFGDFRVVVSPAIAPRFLSPSYAGMQAAALVFTSETGVEGFRRLQADISTVAWCVGTRTAEAARRTGLRAIDGGGDARALVAAIVGSGQKGPLIYARGEDQAADLGALLSAAGIETQDLVVYAQDPKPLTSEAVAVLSGTQPVILPLFSPRTAQILSAAPGMRDRLAPLWIAALSPQIATAAEHLGAARMVIARRPDTDALLDAVTDWLGPDRQP